MKAQQINTCCWRDKCVYSQISIMYYEYSCMYVPGIFKGITGPDLFLSAAPGSAKQNPKTSHTDLCVLGFCLLVFPNSGYCLLTSTPTPGMCQERVRTLPAPGTGNEHHRDTMKYCTRCLIPWEDPRVQQLCRVSRRLMCPLQH